MGLPSIVTRESGFDVQRRRDDLLSIYGNAAIGDQLFRIAA